MLSQNDGGALTPDIPNPGCSSAIFPMPRLAVLSMHTGKGERKKRNRRPRHLCDCQEDALLHTLPASPALLELVLLFSSLVIPLSCLQETSWTFSYCVVILPTQDDSI